MDAKLRNRLLAVAATLGIGTGAAVHVGTPPNTPTPEVQLAMELGAHFESSGRHIGTPYRDMLGKGQPWTVCNGVTGAEVVPGKTYTPEECKQLEYPKYQKAEKAAVRQFHYWDDYNVWVRASIIDMLYNLGPGALTGKTILAKANAGDLAGACEQMPHWVSGTVNGAKTRLPGLVTRRDTTRELCADWGHSGHFSVAALGATP